MTAGWIVSVDALCLSPSSTHSAFCFSNASRAAASVASHRPGFDDRDVRPLRHRTQDVPGPVVEHAGRGDDDRPFGLSDHLNRFLRVRLGRMRVGLGPVRALVVVVEQVVGGVEPGPRDLTGEVEVDRPRHAGAQVPEGVGGVLVEAVGGGAHAALGAAAVGGDALRRDRVDHLVVAGGAEERLEALVGAGAGEHLGAVHRELGRVGGLVSGAGNLLRNADWPILAVGGGGPGLLREQGGCADAGGAGRDEAAPREAGVGPGVARVDRSRGFRPIGGGRVRGVLRR